MNSPLEQFRIKNIFPINLGNLDISFTNSALMMFLSLSVMVLFSVLVLLANRRAFSNNIVLKRIAVAGEYIYEMVNGVVVSSVGDSAKRFLPFIFTLYSFILSCNLLGMFPGSFTVTSHIIVTFAIAAFIFIAVTLIGFIKHGFSYLSILLPKGTPKILMPLMFIIEFFAYLSRPVSLSLRLAANMTAGHIVLKVIASLVILAGLAGIFPFALLVILTGFEIFISILQAYIFTVLTCVYLNDALNMH